MGYELFQHGNLGRGYLHAIANWRFVNTLARMDPSNMFTFRDLDKVCYDKETENYYVLHKILDGFIPEWKLISAVEAQGESNTLYKIGTGVALNGPKVGVTLGIKSLVGVANKINITELPNGTVQITVADNLSVPFVNITGMPNYLPDSYVPPLATSTTPGTISAAQFNKLAGIEIGATANSPDSALRDRSTHTGTQDAVTTLTGLDEAVQDIVASALLAGTNVSIVYNDAMGTIQISATGGVTTFTGLTDTPSSYSGQAGKNVRVKADETGVEFVPGGGGTGDTDLSLGTITGTTVEIVSSTGTSVIVPAATTSNAGLLSASDKTFLNSLSSGLDEQIRDTTAAFIVAGTNVTIVHDDAGNTLTINSTGGGSSSTNLSYTASPTTGTVNSDTGTDAVITLADATNSGLMSPAAYSTVTGLPSDLAEYVRDTVGSLVVAGDNITVTYDDGADTLTIEASVPTLPTYPDTRIPYGQGTTTPLFEADFTYDQSTNTLNIGNGTSSSDGNIIVGGSGSGAGKLSGGGGSLSVIGNPLVLDTTGGADITFKTGTVERARIKNSGAFSLESATISTIAGWNTSKELISLPISTYPSFAELAYLKGATSVIQTQIDSKISGLEIVKNSGSVVGTRKQLNLIEGTNITLTVADDSVNNHVDVTINSTGGSSVDVLNDGMEFCDFYSITNGSIWSGASISSGTATLPSAAQLAGGRGVVRIANSSTANSGYLVMTAASHISVERGMSCRMRLQLITSLGGLNTLIRFGFHGSTTSTTGSNEVALMITGLTVSGSCRKASVSSNTATSYVLSYDLWYGVKIEINSTATLVTFSVFSSSGVSLWSDTVSTNIPEGTPVLRNGLVLTNSGTTAYDLCLLDYMDLRAAGLSRGF